MIIEVDKQDCALIYEACFDAANKYADCDKLYKAYTALTFKMQALLLTEGIYIAGEALK
jgi:hypothetical protein